MDAATITLLAGIISCLIGVATFVTGMTARAKKDGVIEQKLNQALEGIEEIKRDSRNFANQQNALSLSVTTHDEQIKTLFKEFESLDHRLLTLDNRVTEADKSNTTIIQLLKAIAERS